MLTDVAEDDDVDPGAALGECRTDGCIFTGVRG